MFWTKKEEIQTEIGIYVCYFYDRFTCRNVRTFIYTPRINHDGVMHANHILLKRPNMIGYNVIKSRSLYSLGMIFSSLNDFETVVYNNETIRTEDIARYT